LCAAVRLVGSNHIQGVRYCHEPCRKRYFDASQSPRIPSSVTAARVGRALWGLMAAPLFPRLSSPVCEQGVGVQVDHARVLSGFVLGEDEEAERDLAAIGIIQVQGVVADGICSAAR